MSAGKKMPLEIGLIVGGYLKMELKDYVEKIEIVGSVRRKKAEIGDVEVLFIPKYDNIIPEGEFFETNTNLADLFLQEKLETWMLHKRLDIKGAQRWGEKLKLAEFGIDKIPLDLFACTQETWICNYVMRTGGKESNTQIAMAAQKKGWEWRSTGIGFIDAETKEIAFIPKTERELFEAVGLPYLPPEERK